MMDLCLRLNAPLPPILASSCVLPPLLFYVFLFGGGKWASLFLLVNFVAFLVVFSEEKFWEEDCEEKWVKGRGKFFNDEWNLMGEVGWKIGERRGFYGVWWLWWSLNRGKDGNVYYIEENFWDYKIVGNGTEISNVV